MLITRSFLYSTLLFVLWANIYGDQERLQATSGIQEAYSLRGVVTVNETVLISLSSQQDNSSRWLKIGSTFDGYTIEEWIPHERVVRISSSQGIELLHLHRASLSAETTIQGLPVLAQRSLRGKTPVKPKLSDLPIEKQKIIIKRNELVKLRAELQRAAREEDGTFNYNNKTEGGAYLAPDPTDRFTKRPRNINARVVQLLENHVKQKP